MTVFFVSIKLRIQSKGIHREYMNVIGPQVRRIRQRQRMTQEELTARCNLVGWDISRGTLAKIESRVRKVSDFEVALMAKALKVEIPVLYKETAK